MRRRDWFWFALVALFLVPARVGAQTAPRRLAIVVGNGAYRVSSVLPNPPNDARGMTSLLRDLGFEVTQLIDARAPVIRETVTRVVSTTRPDDLVVFFYSGHGMAIRGVNYLLGVDDDAPNDEALFRDRMLPLEQILTQIRQRNVTALLFFDACRSVQALTERWPSLREGGGRTGMADLRAPPNTLVAFSTQPTNVASDGSAGGNSPFTAALLQYLRRPGAEIREVLRLVRAEVLHATNGAQTPWDHSSLTSPVILAAVGNALPAQACSLLGTLRSASGGAATSLRIVNRTRTALSYAWIDTNGRPRPAVQLNPGMERNQTTRAGQVWMVQNQNGQCRSLYQMTPDAAYIAIDD